MQVSSRSSTFRYGITKRPVLAIVLAIAGFVITTFHQTLPGTFPAMFLHGSLRLSPAQVGVLAGILFVGIMISGPIVGRLADAYGRKGPLVASTIILAVGTFLLALAPDYPLLLAARLLCGIGVGGVLPLIFAYLVDVLPPTWRGPSSLGMAASGGVTAFSVVFIIRLSMTLGPEGWRLAAHGFAIATLVAAVAYFFFVERPEATGLASEQADGAPSPPYSSRLIADYWRPFFALLVSAVCITILNAGFFIMMVPMLLGRGFTEQGALAVTGIAVGGSTLSLAVGALISNHVPRYMLLAGAGIISLVSLGIFALIPGSVATMIGAVGTIFGAGLCHGAINYFVAETFPNHLRGRATGFIVGVIGLASAITPVVVSLQFEKGGEKPPLLTIGLSLVILVSTLLLFAPRKPNREA